MGEQTERERTPLPEKLASRNFKLILTIASTLLAGGVGGGTWWATRDGAAPDEQREEIKDLKAKLDAEKEKRLGAIEGRLGKIESAQGRQGRLLSKIAAKMRVKDDEDDEPEDER